MTQEPVPELSMVVTPANRRVADAIVTEVEARFPGTRIERLEVDPDSPSAIAPDGLVVAFVFDSDSADPIASALSAWAGQRDSTPVLPIAADPSYPVPPEPFNGLKSRPWSATGPNPRIIDRIGALLGKISLHSGTKLFVSYTVHDAKDAAHEIHRHLIESGYQAFLDEAPDPVTDGDALELGDDVQPKLMKHVADAQAILLIDSPLASRSRWVHLEVDEAIGQMVPVLPIVMNEPDRVGVSRFRQLKELQRAVVVGIPSRDQVTRPNAEDLEQIVSGLDAYLAAIYRRRVLEVRKLERLFREIEGTFQPFENRPSLYESEVQSKKKRKYATLACCTFEDELFTETLRAYCQAVAEIAQELKRHYFRRYYFHAGDPLFEANEQELRERQLPELEGADITLLTYEDAVINIPKLREAIHALD